jgi:hypothetical protein
MRQHRLSRTPDSPKLVPVTASYDTWGSTPCLPLLPLIWPVQMVGTSRQADFPQRLREPALIIHGEPVRRRHACTNW